MIRTSMLSFILGLCCAPALFGQGLSIGLDDDNLIVLSGNIDLLGFDLQSQAGLLIPVPDDDADPFGFFLANGPEQITYGSLTDTVSIDGELKLRAGYSGDLSSGDLTGEWGGLSDAGQIAFPTIPDPVDPIDPVDPVDPIDPVDPVDPVDPIDPVDPSLPGGGGDPIIPEPSSALLSVFALLGLSFFRRRR